MHRAITKAQGLRAKGQGLSQAQLGTRPGLGARAALGPWPIALGPLLAVLLLAGTASAQGQVEAANAAMRQEMDLTGNWANRLHEDWVERAPGPYIGDYTGLPINDEARAIADAYQVSMQNMPERQCILYTSQYIVMGPQNLRVEAERDPIGGNVIAWHMSGDVAQHLVAATSGDQVLPLFRCTALFALAAICQERHGGVFPPELITRARLLAREYLDA